MHLSVYIYIIHAYIRMYFHETDRMHTFILLHVNKLVFILVVMIGSL